MRLAIACGLVSFLAACSGGPAAPAGTGNNPSAGPFAANTSAGPFAPSQAANPFVPAASPDPFAPVADPGPFGVQPGGTTTPGGGTPAALCAQGCGKAVELGCPIADCETDCVGELSQIPEVCHAAYAAYLSCVIANAACDPDGGIMFNGCVDALTAFAACRRAVAPAPVGPGGGGPPGQQPDAGP